jgi:plastocyanin
MRPLAIAVAVALFGAVGCTDESGGDVTPDSTAPPVVPEGQVLIKGVAFTPRELTTPMGEPVTWVFDDGSFDSGRQSSGTYPKIFNTPGTVPYHCEVHTRMKGTVVVTG